MRILTIITIIALLVSCDNTPNKNQPKETDSIPFKSKSNTQKTTEKSNKRFSANWANPVINPVGSNLGEYVRALFITGQEELLWRFFWDEKNNVVPLESPYESLKTNNWGYEIDLTQLKWNSDSVHFTLFYKTNINNTSGVEQIEGIIVNDTARILLN